MFFFKRISMCSIIIYSSIYFAFLIDVLISLAFWQWQLSLISQNLLYGLYLWILLFVPIIAFFLMIFILPKVEITNKYLFILIFLLSLIVFNIDTSKINNELWFLLPLFIYPIGMILSIGLTIIYGKILKK